MTTSPKDITALEQSIEQRAKRRQRKRQPAMRVNGKSVFQLQTLSKKPRKRRRTTSS